MKKILATFLAFGLGVSFAQDAPKEQPEKAEKAPQEAAQPNRPPRGQMNQQAREQRAKRLKQRLDTAMQDILAEYDVDKDGKLNDDELKAMEAEFQKAAKINQLANSFRQIKLIDTDKDLTLSKEEMDAALEKGIGFGNQGQWGGPNGNRGQRQWGGPNGNRGQRQWGGPNGNRGQRQGGRPGNRGQRQNGAPTQQNANQAPANEELPPPPAE